jgi:hypothetical protein
MRRTMAITAAAVICGGFAGFAGISYATSTGAPDSMGLVPAAAAAENDEGQEDGSEEEQDTHELPGMPVPYGDLLHGEIVTEDPETGEIIYQVQQKGEVTARDGDTVTVESSDGTSWVWTLTDETTVHTDDNWDAEASSVKVGDTVMLSGVREGDVRTAELVRDPAPEAGDVREGLPEQLPEGLPEGLPEELPDDLQLPDLEDLPHFEDEGDGDNDSDSDNDSGTEDSQPS